MPGNAGSEGGDISPEELAAELAEAEIWREAWDEYMRRIRSSPPKSPRAAGAGDAP
jgi:hypothetical protein